MEGEQLPKATMNSYIKSRTNLPFSADYLLKMLYIAKGKNHSIQSLWHVWQTNPMLCVKATKRRPSVSNTSKLLCV